MRLLAGVLISVSLFGCGPSPAGGTGNGSPDANGSGLPDANGSGSGTGTGTGSGTGSGTGTNNDFTVYAHGDHTLYKIDLAQKSLTTIGAFKAPNVMVGTKSEEDTITDLAVAPNNTIYVISETQLYTADPNDGHVTLVGKTSECGSKTVALTTTPDGRIWAGDYGGNICEVDISTNPPTMKAPVTMKNGYALTGDMVGVDNGTVYGTAFKLSDPAKTGTNLSNLLVTVNVMTGDVTVIGSGTMYPNLFGTAFAGGKVFGFTHDGTGRVVTIDLSTGVGTPYATFPDAANPGKYISFAGAGVNSLVVIN